MDTSKVHNFVNNMWDDSIIPELEDYIRIPNKSPMFDPDWDEHGHMEKAVRQLEDWSKKQPIEGMTVDVIKIEGRTPVLFIDIPGQSDDVVLLYGHYDKQPEFTGWADDLSPWVPTIKDGKLYGRGSTDDKGPALSWLWIIEAHQKLGVRLPVNIKILYEGMEEFGSDGLFETIRDEAKPGKFLDDVVRK